MYVLFIGFIDYLKSDSHMTLDNGYPRSNVSAGMIFELLRAEPVKSRLFIPSMWPETYIEVVVEASLGHFSADLQCR